MITKAGHDHQWVTPRIAVGSAVATPDHVHAVLQAGITHVLDCRLRDDGATLYVGTGVRHLHNGTADDGKPKPPEWFHRGVGFVLSSLATPHARILIHCAMGLSRAPSMTYAVLRALGHPADDAVALIKKARPIAGISYKKDADRAIHDLDRKRKAATRGRPGLG